MQLSAYPEDRADILFACRITLTLLFRPLGAIIFGLLSDRFGRKWPLIANLLACAVLSLGTGFANDYGAFLAVRCLFGIAMGGIWGQVSDLVVLWGVIDTIQDLLNLRG